MKLESNGLWKKAKNLAGQIYALLPELSKDVRWTINNKLRGRSFDLSSNIAEAIGAVDPRDKTYYYALARRDAFGLKNALIIGSQNGELELPTDMMVLLEGITEDLDSEISKADKAIPAYIDKFSFEGKGKK